MAINFDRLLADLEKVDTKKVLSPEKRIEVVDTLRKWIPQGIKPWDEFSTLMLTLEKLGAPDETKAIVMLACLEQEDIKSLTASEFMAEEAIKLLPMQKLLEPEIYEDFQNVYRFASLYGQYVDIFAAVPPEKVTYLLNLFYPRLHLITEEHVGYSDEEPIVQLGPLLAKIPADYVLAFLLKLHDDSPFNPNNKIPLSAANILSGIKQLNEEQIDAFCLALKVKISDLVKDPNEFYNLILGFEKWSLDKSLFGKVPPIFMNTLGNIFMNTLGKMKDSLSFSEYRTQALVSLLMKLEVDYPDQQFQYLYDAIPASIKNVEDFTAIMQDTRDKQVLFDRLVENLALVNRLAPILAGDSAGPTVTFMQNLKEGALQDFFTRLPTDTLLQKAWSIACMADENQRVQAALKAATPTGVLSFLKRGQAPTVATEEKIKTAVTKPMVLK